MQNIVLDGKCNTMNILIETGIFGAVSTDGNSSDDYYVYIYILLFHTQCKLKLSFMDRL